MSMRAILVIHFLFHEYFWHLIETICNIIYCFKPQIIETCIHETCLQTDNYFCFDSVCQSWVWKLYLVLILIFYVFKQIELTRYNDRKTCTHLKCLPMLDAFRECVDKIVNTQTAKSCFDWYINYNRNQTTKIIKLNMQSFNNLL